MFSLKWTFERGTLFSVGGYRLSTEMLAVPLLCSGFSHSRGSYVVIRTFFCVCNQSCPCSHRQTTRDAKSVLLLLGVDLTHEARRTSPIWGCPSGVGGNSGFVRCYTVSPEFRMSVMIHLQREMVPSEWTFLKRRQLFGSRHGDLRSVRWLPYSE